MMATSIRQALYAMACGVGLHHLYRWLNRSRVLVLAYHGVEDRPLPAACPEWHHLDRTDFERQIRYLARHYRIVSIDEALVELARGSVKGLACITFDDGYRNNLDVVLPVIRRLGVPVTIYLATGLVGSERVLWTVELEAALRASHAASIDLADIGLGVVPLHDDAQRKRLASRVIDSLKAVPAGERVAAVDHILEQLGRPPHTVLAAFRMLDWSEVAQLENSGLVTFGGHTVNHEILSRLDDAGINREIGESIAVVSQRTARTTRTFAFPNGRPQDFDNRAKRALRELGIQAALSTIDGLNDPHTDRFELRRVTVGRDDDFNCFRMATSGLSATLRRWSSRFRRRR